MKMFVSKLQSVGFSPQVSFSLKDDSCHCLFCGEEVMELCFVTCLNPTRSMKPLVLFKACMPLGKQSSSQGFCHHVFILSFIFGKCFSLFLSPFFFIRLQLKFLELQTAGPHLFFFFLLPYPKLSKQCGWLTYKYLLNFPVFDSLG